MPSKFLGFAKHRLLVFGIRAIGIRAIGVRTTQLQLRAVSIFAHTLCS